MVTSGKVTAVRSVNRRAGTDAAPAKLAHVVGLFSVMETETVGPASVPPVGVVIPSGDALTCTNALLVVEGRHGGLASLADDGGGRGGRCVGRGRRSKHRRRRERRHAQPK